MANYSPMSWRQGRNRFSTSQRNVGPPPVGGVAALTSSRDSLMNQAAAMRQQAEQRKMLEQQQKAQNVQGGQQLGAALGGLAGTAASLAPPLAPLAPLLVSGGAALGSQIGRAAAGGEMGFGQALPDVANVAQSIPQATRGYRQGQQEGLVSDYIARMSEQPNAGELLDAWANMPTSVADEFNRGRFDLFENYWVPSYRRGL